MSVNISDLLLRAAMARRFATLLRDNDEAGPRLLEMAIEIEDEIKRVSEQAGPRTHERPIQK